MRPSWYPNWKGETCVIIASGPSINEVDVNLIKGKARCIAINNNWEIAPWADILYACDAVWWRNNPKALAFKGLKITQDKLARDEFGINRVICERHHENLVIDRPGFVGWGGNSGFHTLNLTVQFYCSKVILVGFDMHLKNGTHWHGEHPNGMHNPSNANVDRWRRTFDAAAPVLKRIGVEVINTSINSALRNYPKMTLVEALG